MEMLELVVLKINGIVGDIVEGICEKVHVELGKEKGREQRE